MNNRYDVPLQLNNENPITAIISYLVTDMDILEMGPASGRLTRYLSSEMDCRVSIVEIDQHSYVKARQFAVDGICADLEGNSWFEYYEARKFDAVIFADVIEHLNKPVEVIQKAKSLLKEDGKILFSIPNIAHAGVISQLLNNKFQYTETGILDYTHAKFYTYSTFHSMLKDCGMLVYSEKAIHQDINTGDWPDFDNLEDETKKLLRNREFSDVFEYVFAAVTQEWYEGHSNEFKIERLKGFKGTTAVSTLYIDYGDGFSQDNYYQANMLIDADGYSFSVVFNLSGIENIKQLRFDPCDYECKIALNSVNGDAPKDIVAINHFTIKDEMYYFLTKDPNFLITNKDILTSKSLEIRGKIEKVTIKELLDIIHGQNSKLVERINAEHEEAEKLSLLHDNEINNLKTIIKTLAKKSEESAVINGSLNTLSEEADSLKQLLVAKSEEAGSVKAELELKKSEADALNVSLAEKSKEIDTLKESLIEKSKEVESLKESLTDKSEEVDTLKESLADKSEEIYTLKGQITAKNTELNSLKEILAAKTEEAASLNQTLAEKHEEASKAKQHLISMIDKYNNLSDEYSRIINSQCWRITKPIRIVLDTIKRISYKIKAYRLVLYLKKAFVYCRHNGVVMTLRKIKNRLFPKTNTTRYITDISTPAIGSIEIKPVSVSVVIPTYNAGQDLQSLLKSLSHQEGIGFMEIIIVDSGSIDNTVEIAKSYGANVISIPQEKFSHSYSRNLGAKSANGENILFMTQDALPGSNHWLMDMYTPLITDPNIAAVSCGESPKPDADLFGLACSWGHARFMGVLNSDRIMRMPNVDSIEEIRRNANLNDVACLIRKRVFEDYEYRFDYAEDLDLGIRLTKNGHHLALLGTIKVIHSHNRSEFYYLKRAFVERKAFKKIFPAMPLIKVNEQDFLLGAKWLFNITWNIVADLSIITNEQNIDEYVQKIEGILKKREDIIANNIDLVYKPQNDFIEFIHTIEDKTKTLNTNKLTTAVKDSFDIYFISQSGMIIDYMKNHLEIVNRETNYMFCKALFCVCANAIGDILGYSWLAKHNDKLLVDIYEKVGKGV